MSENELSNYEVFKGLFLIIVFLFIIIYGIPSFLSYQQNIIDEIVKIDESRCYSWSFYGGFGFSWNWEDKDFCENWFYHEVSGDDCISCGRIPCKCARLKEIFVGEEQ